MEEAYTKTVDEVLKLLGTDVNTGLYDEQVLKSLRTYGPNGIEIPSEPQPGVLDFVTEVFKDRLVIILLISAGISMILSVIEGDNSVAAYAEPAIILLILLLNGLVQVVQDLKTENAIQALKTYTPEESRVLRNGSEHKIKSTLIVPGDIVILSAGDKIPADCRVIEVLSSTFEVDQSILTGESESVCKMAEEVHPDVGTPNSEQLNMVFGGTIVVFGKAIVAAVRTGKNSTIGSIQASLSNSEDSKTPLKKSLDEFGLQLSKIITFICVAVWFMNMKNFGDASHHKSWFIGAIYYFKIAISLAVAAIPEGLSVIITTSLALGTKRMARKGALVRRLKSVETLGCTTVICSDKTGTLTTNNMCVKRAAVISASNLCEILIEGNTFSTFGRLKPLKGLYKDRSSIQSDFCFTAMAFISIMCNNSKVVYDSNDDKYIGIGEATDNAFLVMAEKLFFDPDKPTSDEGLTVQMKTVYSNRAYDTLRSIYRISNSLEFTRDRKIMSVEVKKICGYNVCPIDPLYRSSEKDLPSGKSVLLVKGAPEFLLESSTHYLQNKYPYIVPMSESIKAEIYSSCSIWGSEYSFRVLGLAFKLDPNIPSKLQRSDYFKYEKDLVFVGIAGMEDPLRKEVAKSVLVAQNAGVDVIVITGDNKKTAEAVCSKLGLFGPDDSAENISFTGKDIDKMGDENLKIAVRSAKLFSRVEPHHKSMLVSALRQNGHIVAMTGDGVNDASALKAADIGISMGSGTDVAKFASDIVLMNDDFSSIVAAIEEGRLIFSNTRQFIRYLISSNIGEVFSILFTVLLGMPESLKPVQLLWINLVTDGLPATALGFNPPDSDLISQAPRDTSEPIVTQWLMFRYFVIGLYVGIATLLGYAWSFLYYTKGPKITFSQLCEKSFPQIGCSMFIGLESMKASTVSLSILVVIEMFNGLNSISENRSLLELPPTKNMKLVYAIAISILLHIIILYTPYFADAFAVVPMDLEEWAFVIAISIPIILIDEALKLFYRCMNSRRRFKVD